MDNQLLRLATFENLPESADLFPSIVSKAGFYYTGEGYTVECYSCGLRLNNCESGIHPMTVHRRLSPECQFVISQPLHNESTQQDVASASGTSPQVSRRHNNQRTRRGRLNHYQQLALNAVSPYAAAGTNNNQTSYPSRPISSTYAYTNMDRLTSRRMRDRINNNDPSLMEEMKSERCRLASFENWSRDMNIAPGALAKAGLFDLCLADRVKCAFCGGILRNWGPSEEPMRKHRQLFPGCPFVRDPRAAGDVAIGDEPSEGRLLNVTSNTSDDTTVGQLGIETARPKHPGMAIEAVRLASFDRWPRSNPVTPESLARAGFYYTGVYGEVTCFFCDGRLTRWNRDEDPMTKHRQLYPSCGFVKITADTSTDARDTLLTDQNLTCEATQRAGDEDQGQSGAASARDKLTCAVCMDAQKNLVFLPCRHFACCANCGSSLSTCPVCRSDIQARITTFLA